MGKDIRKTIDGNVYQVVDVINGIVLPDSWSLNKKGTGHGEGKLYVGADSGKGMAFFDGFDRKCLILKEDLEHYLQQVKDVIIATTQSLNRSQKWEDINRELSSFDDVLWFEIIRADVTHPGNYINCKKSSNKADPYYTFLRKIAIPKLSSLSIMKLRKEEEYYYLFRIIYEASPEVVERHYHPNYSQKTRAIGRSYKVEAKAREGQSVFRNSLLKQMGHCPFTGIDDPRLLIASHIKPWECSDEKEKVDSNNGLLLSATYDRLFDQGLITFNKDGSLKLSVWLSEENKKRLGLIEGMMLPDLKYNKKKDVYMAYHREHVFLK